MIPLAFTILSFLAASARGRINVDIVASDTGNERQVHLSGTDAEIISDKEVESFHLKGDALRDAVYAYFGSIPTDAYLKSPTPWGDLYKTYDWPEVRRVLTPIKARILGVKSESTIVLTQIFNNTSTKNATFNTKIQQEVENTVTSEWRKGGNLNVSQTIQYGFDIKVAASVSGKTSFSYTAYWGESVKKTETVTVGSESGVEINLGPGDCVIAELYATRGTMTVEVDYEAALSGSTAVNYHNTFRGHHFWSFDINSVMSAAGLKRTIMSTETIHLGYYSDSEIILKDAKAASGEIYFHIEQ